ncbi:hypothetical protein H6G89_01940 [Oscillatoria sp. FACHB-1407]|uniref:hypothetical protein n=1 Tax=Oscillatoria sp. FACHB-1407 TaxID=2692847 RepID=UPI00168479FC|nr:hypothetical protein [Oscillatoria sp. FACHB-1407]MBD2459794.1 hypothetical protein [Oscillatoria sp. FACHB-1407]
MNSRLLERSPPTRTPENAGFDEPTQVDFAPDSGGFNRRNPYPEFKFLSVSLGSRLALQSGKSIAQLSRTIGNTSI